MMIFEENGFKKWLFANGTLFCELLFLLFLGLKLAGAITWSMLWVFAPIWIPVVAYLFYVLVQFIVAFTIVYKEKNNNDKKEK